MKPQTIYSTYVSMLQKSDLWIVHTFFYFLITFKQRNYISLYYLYVLMTSYPTVSFSDTYQTQY